VFGDAGAVGQAAQEYDQKGRGGNPTSIQVCFEHSRPTVERQKQTGAP
jgi:hypothetical protein